MTAVQTRDTPPPLWPARDRRELVSRPGWDYRPRSTATERKPSTSRRPSRSRLARDAAACVAAGARTIHLHPRDSEGQQTLEAGVVDEVVKKVRGACGVPVGTTTSAEIEPDPERRLGLVRAWREPDYASVNLSEAGAMESWRSW